MYIIAEVLTREIGYDTVVFALAGDAFQTAELRAEQNVACIILITDEESTNRQGGMIYHYWRGLFPDVPIVWYHGDTNSDFWKAKWMKNVAWCNDDIGHPLTALITAVNKAVN